LRFPNFPYNTAMAKLHREYHFSSSKVVRDIVIGMADGLTVPFALAAGLSGAVSTNRIIVLAGLAEIAAGSIAMGLGGYLAARGDLEHYESERQREVREVEELPEEEEKEIAVIFEQYGVNRQQSRSVLEALKAKPQAWVDFMMRFELGLEKPESGRAVHSAGTIAASYVIGGLIPLSPYMLVSPAHKALAVSVIITLIALGVFGFIKGKVTSNFPLRSALQTMMIGSIAAAAAFGLARLLSTE
jgi:vacuolar iron transporter family protein